MDKTEGCKYHSPNLADRTPLPLPLHTLRMQILDAGLRRDFGFQHILYVYSGRRGVHAWVCDDRARCLSDEQRTAVANYFAVYRGQEGGLARLALGLEEHPAVTRAAAILEPVFVEVQFLFGKRRKKCRRNACTDGWATRRWR